ncbi:MAG: hypothetical protein QN178_16945 [Armatimonadota bacterium]|nr:hypothetical protein [Armatimonadota bacterium]
MRRAILLSGALVVSLATALGLLAWAYLRDSNRGTGHSAAPLQGPPSVPAPGAPAAEPVVPVDLPTPAPGLDRALAADFRKALEGQGVRVAALTITDTRATGGVRRVEIVYRTTTGRTLGALRTEIVRVAGPGANPRLALDQIAVRATTPSGKPIAAVVITVADLDRWLKAEMTDVEFYSRWTAPPAR